MLWCRRGVPVFLAVICFSLMGCVDTAAEKAKAEKPKQAVVEGPIDPDAPKEFTTTESGLKYRILRKSDGKKLTNDDENVSAYYRGRLNNSEGAIFETAYGKTGSVKILVPQQMIPGVREGLKLVGEGGMIELIIPSKLGYGSSGQPPFIPPNSDLHFIIEILKIISPPPSEFPPVEPGAVDSDAKEEFTTTDSGLKYRIRRQSSGKKPVPSSNVSCHYRGWLDDGKVFDESYKRGQATDFRLNGVIAGWTEGLQLIGEGGMIELEIPGNLAYGEKGQPPTIGPNATLHFLVELVKVN